MVETIIFQEGSLDKKCLVKLILPSSFETGLVLVICLSTKFEPSLTFVWKLSSLKEVTVRTEPHYGVTCSITLFLTGKILRLAQFGSVLRRGGLAQSFGGVTVKNFLCAAHEWSNYLEGAFDFVVYDSEKIRTIRHTNPKIFNKTAFHVFFSPVSNLVGKTHDVGM